MYLFNSRFNLLILMVFSKSANELEVSPCLLGYILCPDVGWYVVSVFAAYFLCNSSDIICILLCISLSIFCICLHTCVHHLLSMISYSYMGVWKGRPILHHLWVWCSNLLITLGSDWEIDGKALICAAIWGRSCPSVFLMMVWRGVVNMCWCLCKMYLFSLFLLCLCL